MNKNLSKIEAEIDQISEEYYNKIINIIEKNQLTRKEQIITTAPIIAGIILGIYQEDTPIFIEAIQKTHTNKEVQKILKEKNG